MTITTEAICFRGGRRMSWQRVAALGLLVGGAIAAAAFHNDRRRYPFCLPAPGHARLRGRRQPALFLQRIVRIVSVGRRHQSVDLAIEAIQSAT